MIDFDYWSPTYIAIGGGSVIDSSKAIAIGAANGGEWRRFYVGKEVKVRPVIPAALPVGVVLTIAAAGSEGSTNSIINLEPENLKRGAGGDILRPKFAILNPELTMTLPPFQTACGLADMFAHLCERYFSPTPDVTLTDNLCEAVMRTVVEESAKEADIPLLVKTLNLSGNTLGGFQPLAESDVAAIYRLCLEPGI